MEPKIYSGKTEINKPKIVILVIILGLIIASAFMILRSQFTLFNRAADDISDEIGPDYCQEAYGKCVLSESELNKLPATVRFDIIANKNFKLVVTDEGGNIIKEGARGELGPIDFITDKNKSSKYICTLVLLDSSGNVLPPGDELRKIICPEPVEGDSAVCKKDCKCVADESKLCPPDTNVLPIEWEPIFVGQYACFKCEKIIVEDDEGLCREEFDCNGGKKARLHQGSGRACRTYKIKVIGAIDGEPAAETPECSCEKQVCCPDCQAVEEIQYKDYFNPPLSENGDIKSGCGYYEGTDGINKTQFLCDFNFGQNACPSPGDEVKPILQAPYPKVVRICYDDLQDNSCPSETPNHKCETYNLPQDLDKIKHLYKDGGRYDIAMWCPLNYSLDPIWNNAAVCVKRITVACEGEGGTPPPPTLTPTGSVTPSGCPIEDLNVRISCQ